MCKRHCGSIEGSEGGLQRAFNEIYEMCLQCQKLKLMAQKKRPWSSQETRK